MNQDITPSAFKARVLEKYPTDIASDGRAYKDIPAEELVQKFVDKYPNDVTSDGIPYTAFLSANFQPRNEPERNYLKEAGKLYNKTFGAWSQKGLEAGSEIVMEIGNKISSPLQNLALGIYASSKKKQSSKLDEQTVQTIEKITEHINNPSLPLERKKMYAQMLTTIAPPNMIDQIVGDKTAMKALYDTANSMFETAILGYSGGLGLATKGSRIPGLTADLSVKGGLTKYVEALGAGANKWQIAKEVLRGTLTSAGVYGGLEAGRKTAEGMSENKPLEEILSSATKEGLTFAGIIAAIEAGIPAVGGTKGIIAKMFGGAANVLSRRGQDVEKLLSETENVVKTFQKTAPKSDVVGERVLAPISLEEKALQAEQEQILKNSLKLLEEDYVTPGVSSLIIGREIQSQFDNWIKSEKEFADQYWGQGFLSVTKGETANFDAALDGIKSTFANVKGWDSFKNNINRLAKETEDPSLREALSKYGKAVMEKAGVSASAQGMTVNEMILSERGVRDLIGKETVEGYKQTAPFYKQLSEALNKDILETLKKTDPIRAEEYIAERARWSEFKEKLVKTKETIKSDDPLEAIFNMSPQEIESLYGIKNFQDNIAYLQDGLLRHAFEKARKADGTYNISMLEKYIEKANNFSKSGIDLVPPEDLRKLISTKNLITLTQGYGKNATLAQKEELQKLLGDEFASLEQTTQKLTDVETALSSLGRTDTIESLVSKSDTIIDNLKKIKSAKVFDSIWSKLDANTQADVRRVIYKNAFAESFSTAGNIGANLNNFKTYLESIGIGAGNKPEIIEKIFSPAERKQLGEIYTQIDQIEDFLTAPNTSVVRILHSLLAFGYIKTGAAPASLYHFGRAFQLSGKSKPNLEAEKVVSELLGVTPEEVKIIAKEAEKYRDAQSIIDAQVIKPDFDKFESQALIEMAKIFEKMLIYQQQLDEKEE